MILRANRPLPTSRAPAPNANSEAALPPPVFGSSALGGAGAGAGAGGGAGAGAAALGAGGGGGGGLHGALATTPPALDSIIPSLQSASAFAPAGPPAMAVLALASATIWGSSCARAGAANASAIASTAA